MFEEKKPEGLPDAFWKNHIVTTFAETIKWWVDNKMKVSPEEITEYFFKVV